MAGSIEKRGKDSYRLIVTNGFDLTGKVQRHTKQFMEQKKMPK